MSADKRREAIEAFWKENPYAGPGECDVRMAELFPEQTKDSHRGLRGRMYRGETKPWEHTCPKCVAKGAEKPTVAIGHEAIGGPAGFGFRKINGKERRQSWCRACRLEDGRERARRKAAEKQAAAEAAAEKPKAKPKKAKSAKGKAAKSKVKESAATAAA